MFKERAMCACDRPSKWSSKTFKSRSKSRLWLGFPFFGATFSWERSTTSRMVAPLSLRYDSSLMPMRAVSLYKNQHSRQNITSSPLAPLRIDVSKLVWQFWHRPSRAQNSENLAGSFFFQSSSRFSSKYICIFLLIENRSVNSGLFFLYAPFYHARSGLSRCSFIHRGILDTPFDYNRMDCG